MERTVTCALQGPPRDPSPGQSTPRPLDEVGELGGPLRMGWRESSSPPRGPWRPLGGCLCQPWGFEANMQRSQPHTRPWAQSHTCAQAYTHVHGHMCACIRHACTHRITCVRMCTQLPMCNTPACTVMCTRAQTCTRSHMRAHVHTRTLFRCVSVPRTQILLSRSPTPTPAPPASSQADLLPSRRLPVEHEEAQTPHISSWISLPCQKSSRLGQMPPLPTLS